MSSFLNPNDSHAVTFNPYSCYTTGPGMILFSIFNITYSVLLLPLCILVIYYGFHQLKEKGHNSLISHCDSFTYHMVSIELIGILGCIICFCGNCMESLNVSTIGINVFSFICYGQMFFHDLTCVEHYLAVVHPITYRSLRSERGLRIRNITIACVWLLSVVGIIFDTMVKASFLPVFLLVSSTVSISYCSLSVLYVLIRPGPVERGEGRMRVDQSKQRAFYTIVTILGILMLRLCFGLAWACVELSEDSNRCKFMICGVWINLPSSLVLPLLFRQRAGKLECCK